MPRYVPSRLPHALPLLVSAFYISMLFMLRLRTPGTCPLPEAFHWSIRAWHMTCLAEVKVVVLRLHSQLDLTPPWKLPSNGTPNCRPRLGRTILSQASPFFFNPLQAMRSSLPAKAII